MFYDGFPNKSELVLVGSFQSFHGSPQPTDMPVYGAARAGPALYAFLPLELQQSSADIHNVVRTDLQGEVVKRMDFNGSLNGGSWYLVVARCAGY